MTGAGFAALYGDRLPTLATERFLVRHLEEADAPALFDIFSDPEVTRYWSSPPLADREAARELLRQIQDFFQSRTLLQWGIAQRSTGRVIGTCTLAWLDAQNRRADLGFAVARQQWGEGVASEAVPAVLRFGFQALNLHRVEADVDPRNLASVRVLERLGFQREGFLRERYLLNGEAQDAWFYGLLRSEWRGGEAEGSQSGDPG